MTAKSHAIRLAVQTVVLQIPKGKVCTYGAVARLAGFPRNARMVGRCMDDGIPWYRVVNSQGRISPRGLDGNDDLQRFLLEAEGVEFGSGGRIDLEQYGWFGEAGD
ncbi:methylated-DNA-protein-cysteine methyltransferase-like protein [Silvimonas terrae]|uniref:Methylated-DNA-protein-cysteine methyltransferase-like protein n=1 Tax=Silvimonas terrae TaxID=300266 RepID=A0A840RGN9_9NEIS|nr:MGMT family protein [Silvimonas terrae]MBB5191452.1 methylated-DNA-protein-cysteine methyltransferase-like protein [Silvimonas terrae]